MDSKRAVQAALVVVGFVLIGCGDDAAAVDGDAVVCGPQSPRDITRTEGTNLTPVPGGDTPNLCNVHFHVPYEHAGFADEPSTSAPDGTLVCANEHGGVDFGDRVEFHWVYTNCDVPDTPVPGLANCQCDRPDLALRVYAQAYVVDVQGATPTRPSEDLVHYLGSTTGVSYDNTTCSPARVNWEVAPTSLALSRSALAEWCTTNPWPGENHPHGSRDLVTSPDWLSPM